MATRTDLLAFMKKPSEDGTYEAPKPTDEQLAAVLPWLVDATVTWAKANGHCDTVNDALYAIFGLRGREVKFYTAAGYDCYGFNREGRNAEGYDQNGYDVNGFDKRGFDRHGYNKDGYSRYGYDKDGYDKDGRDQYGKTRAEKVAELVKGRSKEHIAAVAAKLAARKAAKEAEEAAAKAAEEAANAPTEELAAAAV